MRSVREAWGRIREPRVLRALFWLGYAVTLYTGLVTLMRPPSTIEGALGPLLAASWSIFWVTGGLVGMCTVLTGWWQVERTAAAAALFGIGIYAGVLITLHLTQPGSRLTQLGVLAIACLFFVIRLVLIHGHDFEPRS